MGDIINLRHARKAKARRDREKVAGQNRILFGRTKTKKARDEKSKVKMDQAIEGAHRVTKIEDPAKE
ncbi:DUF4169 family protein [Sphingobium amiense]|uniref:DUF4169 family protein n=1 Tax=Sphingobium amiense TaxID=135719 RepID=UPI00082B6C7E|nr:DUF4169 family protein [Sphingobium amiense]